MNEMSLIVLALAAAACVVVGIVTLLGRGPLVQEHGKGKSSAYYGVVFCILGVAFAGITLGNWLNNNWLRIVAVGAGLAVGVMALLRSHFTGKKK